MPTPAAIIPPRRRRTRRGKLAGLARRRPTPATMELNDQASGARSGQQGQVGPPQAQRPLHGDGNVIHVRRRRPAGEPFDGEDDGVEAQGPEGPPIPIPVMS
eukprot:1089377-Alexandrium_andersonii.AAC.1